jgi:hypothetical protein
MIDRNERERLAELRAMIEIYGRHRGLAIRKS